MSSRGRSHSKSRESLATHAFSMIPACWIINAPSVSPADSFVARSVSSTQPTPYAQTALTSSQVAFELRWHAVDKGGSRLIERRERVQQVPRRHGGLFLFVAAAGPAIALAEASLQALTSDRRDDALKRA